MSGNGNMITINPTTDWQWYELTHTAPTEATVVRVEVLRGVKIPENTTLYVAQPEFFKL